MDPESCTLWNIVSGIIGLIAGSGGTLLAIKIQSHRRDTTTTTQRDINTGGGDVAGRDINKKR